MIFEITTSKEVAEQISRQFEWERTRKMIRTIKLSKVEHFPGVINGYSIVTLESAGSGDRTELLDMFWLGYHSNLKP